jgi:uncharacterized protein YutE (UPF0331/DUF86 family)
VTGGRVRAAVVAAKSEIVLHMLAGIETLPLDSEDALAADPRMLGAGESFLRRALEALFDLGRHVLAKGFGIPGAEYKDVARYLGTHAVLGPGDAATMVAMAGYRNRLVHFYDEVTPAELYRILTVHRGDIRLLLNVLTAWVDSHPEIVDDAL